MAVDVRFCDDVFVCAVGVKGLEIWQNDCLGFMRLEFGVDVIMLVWFCFMFGFVV